MKERKVWEYMRLTPIVAAVALVSAQLLIPDDAFLPIVGWVWLIVAAASLVIADVIRRYTRNLMLLARRRGEAEPEIDQAWIFRMETNHSISVITEEIHVIFVVVGFLVAVADPDSVIRLAVSRNGLLLGQYLLLMIVFRNYLSYRVAYREVQEEEEREDELR